MESIVREYSRAMLALASCFLILGLWSFGVFDNLSVSIGNMFAGAASQEDMKMETTYSKIDERTLIKENLDSSISIVKSHLKKGSYLKISNLFDADDGKSGEISYRILEIEDPDGNVVTDNLDDTEYMFNKVGKYRIKVRAISVKESVISKIHTFYLAVTF